MIQKGILIAVFLLGTAVTVAAQQGLENEDNAGKIIATPYGRYINPAGQQVIFGEPSLENHAMDCALSGDGKWLAIEERYSIVFINTATREIAFRFPLSDIAGFDGIMNTYSGITWDSSNGEHTLWWSASGNNDRSFVIEAKWDGNACTIQRYFKYKSIPPARLALPNELLIRQESGKTLLYVVLNGNNQLIKQDAENGDTIWMVKLVWHLMELRRLRENYMLPIGAEGYPIRAILMWQAFHGDWHG